MIGRQNTLPGWLMSYPPMCFPTNRSVLVDFFQVAQANCPCGASGRIFEGPNMCDPYRSQSWLWKATNACLCTEPHETPSVDRNTPGQHHIRDIQILLLSKFFYKGWERDLSVSVWVWVHTLHHFAINTNSRDKHGDNMWFLYLWNMSLRSQLLLLSKGIERI